MVYGFVKQSGGRLRIERSPGRGTTVNPYLPRFVGTVTKSDPGEAGAMKLAVAGEVIRKRVEQAALPWRP